MPHSQIELNQRIDRPVLNEEYKEYLENTEFATMNSIQDSTTFFTVISCINNYIQYNAQKNVEKLDILLSEEYKKQNNITRENMLNNITLYSPQETFSAKEIHEYKNNENLSTYFVYGKMKESSYFSDNPKKQDIFIAIQLDKVNRTFSVILDEKKDSSKIGKNININEIKNYTINEYTTPKIAETQIGILYFSDYKEKMLENINTAYQQLEELYKKNRFNTFVQFQEYVTKNEELEYITVVNCSVEKENEKNKYTCKDQYGNVYIFRETAIMEYTVELDDYTLENEAFTKKYNEVNNRDKGILNVDKFFKMLNMQDYQSAYSLLDNNFKQTYFKTQTDFENYMKNKVFRYNKVEYEEYSNQITDIHTYKVKLSDATEQSEEKVEFNIVMKLLEGTNFVMSFEVN